MSDQFVYFIQADQDGPIKIGFTSDKPEKRLSQLQTGNASALKLLGAINAPASRERQFHAELSEWRLQGEWFAPHPTVLAAIGEALSAEPIQCGGPHCSFCGICQHEVAVLIAGPNDVYICSQCAGRCAKEAAEYFQKAAEAALSVPVPEVGCSG